MRLAVVTCTSEVQPGVPVALLSGTFAEQTEAPDELTGRAVYHYYPPLAKVREWIDQADLIIELEGAGSGFHHFLARKK
jgi:hypothetical protein